MGNHLITEILKIEQEADNIVANARQRAVETSKNTATEIGFVKTTLENEYRQKLETLKARFAELHKSEEERLGIEFESLKKKLLQINIKSVNDAVDLAVKYICES